MAYISITNSFSDGDSIDANQINQNNDDIINGLSDGTKDIKIASLNSTGLVVYDTAEIGSQQIRIETYTGTITKVGADYTATIVTSAWVSPENIISVFGIFYDISGGYSYTLQYPTLGKEIIFYTTYINVQLWQVGALDIASGDKIYLTIMGLV